MGQWVVTGTLTLPTVLEREFELAAIDAALGSALEGEGQLIFVEAHAGLGKSALLGHAGSRGAFGGMRVLSASGTELERGHSFGVAMQLFEPTVVRLDNHARDDLLGGAAALARPLFEGHAAAAGPPAEQLFSLLHGLYWLTSNLAERQPLVIAADDAHWADPSSLRFFLYLAQRLSELPVLLIMTSRLGEPGAPRGLLRQLRTHHSAQVLRPAALSLAGVATLVGDRMGSPEPEFVAACASATGGNPYLLNELLTDFDHRGVEPSAEQAEEVGRLAPDSVLEAALVRLSRLPTGAPELARAVTVLSDQATMNNVNALTGLPTDLATAAVNALIRAELLRPGRPLAFMHPLLHSAIYREISAADRGDLHGKAARLLSETGAPGETVAAHLVSSTRRGDPWVVEQLRAAAQRSLAMGAADSAVGYLERALEEPPPRTVRPDLLLELGKAESVSGRADAATKLNQALELIADPRRRAEVLRELGWTLQKSGDMSGALEAFERGLAEVSGLEDDAPTTPDVASLQIAHLAAATGCAVRAPASPMLERSIAELGQRLVDETRAKPKRDLEPHERELLLVRAMDLLFKGDAHEEVIELSLEIWGEGQLLEQEGSNAPTIWHLIGCLSWADALDAAEDIIEAALETAAREGSIVTLALGYYSRSWPRYWRGDLATSAADAEAAISAWSGEFSMYLPVAAHWYALAQLELGDLESAAAALDFPDAQERWGETNLYVSFLAGLGMVAMARRRPAEAIDLFEATGRSALGSRIVNPAVTPWRSYLSSARLASGDRAGARVVALEEVELARRFGAPRPLGIALRAAGLAEGGRPGIGMLEEAVSVLRSSPSNLELARALVALGGALRRDNRAGEAREPLREGMAIADRIGARVLGGRAHDELLSAGAKPRRRALRGPGSLTPTESRVATMAASGMTNREIAQALFVTVKAVQWHLRNAYRKLEVSGREDLRTALVAE